jgi:tagatose-1,6-bisphosphate aldolase non-catalytic subunit AgaZ/GatZ
VECKPKVIPVIIGVTGITSKAFRKYVSYIQGNHEVKNLQNTAIFGTAHIIPKCSRRDTMESTQELAI